MCACLPARRFSQGKWPSRRPADAVVSAAVLYYCAAQRQSCIYLAAHDTNSRLRHASNVDSSAEEARHAVMAPCELPNQHASADRGWACKPRGAPRSAAAPPHRSEQPVQLKS